MGLPTDLFKCSLCGEKKKDTSDENINICKDCEQYEKGVY